MKDAESLATEVADPRCCREPGQGGRRPKMSLWPMTCPADAPMDRASRRVHGQTLRWRRGARRSLRAFASADDCALQHDRTCEAGGRSDLRHPTCPTAPLSSPRGHATWRPAPPRWRRAPPFARRLRRPPWAHAHGGQRLVRNSRSASGRSTSPTGSTSRVSSDGGAQRMCVNGRSRARPPPRVARWA